MESTPETIVKPVFLVDKGIFLSYSSYIRRILVGLADTAHAAVLVCPAEAEAQAILCPSVERIEHPALRLPIFWNQNRRILLERLMRFRPTVLHAFYPGHIHLAQWLADELNVPCVLTFHREPQQWIRFEKPIRRAARMIAPSQVIANALGKKWAGLHDRLVCIPVGSFTEDQCCCFSRPVTTASLVAVHALDSFETIKPLLNALRHLVLDGFEMMAVIMGEGRAEKMIRRHIRTLGLTPVVTMLPPIRPMRDIFSGADIYMHLKDSGCFDAELLEAMAVGLAVVGCPEKTNGLLFDGQTACFWDPHDELSIYACLKNALSQRERMRHLAQNAQSHLRRHNSVSRMVDRLMETYVQAQQWHKQHRKQTAVELEE
ncbi:MAG: glycosyltransferase family 4 protein [Planctomycetales bacterium]|nr:glycosyltransferase family 4 protein [Planctomycetales bacterium]